MVSCRGNSLCDRDRWQTIARRLHAEGEPARIKALKRNDSRPCGQRRARAMYLRHCRFRPATATHPSARAFSARSSKSWFWTRTSHCCPDSARGSPRTAHQTMWVRPPSEEFSMTWRAHRRLLARMAGSKRSSSRPELLAVVLAAYLVGSLKAVLDKQSTINLSNHAFSPTVPCTGAVAELDRDAQAVWMAGFPDGTPPAQTLIHDRWPTAFQLPVCPTCTVVVGRRSHFLDRRSGTTTRSPVRSSMRTPWSCRPHNKPAGSGSIRAAPPHRADAHGRGHRARSDWAVGWTDGCEYSAALLSAAFWPWFASSYDSYGASAPNVGSSRPSPIDPIAGTRPASFARQRHCRAYACASRGMYSRLAVCHTALTLS